MRFLCFLICTLSASLVSAAVYKVINQDGTVSYSDKHQVGAEQIDVGTVQTYEALQLSPLETKKQTSEFPGYETFHILSPLPNQTLRDNGGLVSISLSLSPALFRDHILIVRMDGAELGSGRAMNFTLSNVDRGSHVLQGLITDKEGNLVSQTAAVTFHLHRTSTQ
tara:strand:+ start:382 stop:879 length:498 start_codon:yes stop_codon:yes gene_type:complete